MAEHFLHHFQRHSGCEHQTRRAVAEVVQPDRRQPGRGGDGVEPVRDRLRVQRRPVLPGEHLPRLHPRRRPLHPLGQLPTPVRPQHLDRAAVERHRAVPGVRLRRPLDHLPPDLHELTAHRQRAGCQVDVLPFEPGRLTAAQAEVRDRVPQPVQPVGVGVVEELPQLRRRPHHNRRWRLRGHLELRPLRRVRVALGEPVDRGTPPVDSLRRPHQRLRALSRGELHQRGRVHEDEALAQRIVQRGPQRRPDPLPGRVRARHLGEHLGDVRDPQVVEAQVPEVGQVVVPDLAGVGAAGAWPDVGLAGDPLGEEHADCDIADDHAAAGLVPHQVEGGLRVRLRVEAGLADLLRLPALARDGRGERPRPVSRVPCAVLTAQLRAAGAELTAPTVDDLGAAAALRHRSAGAHGCGSSSPS
nr:hypothetical protein [Pseudonocardia nigra]